MPANLFFKYKRAFPQAEIVDISKIIRKIRMIKSDYEISIMKKSAELAFKMFSAAKDIIKPGITEIEAGAQLEAVYRKNGHQGGIRLHGFNQELFYGHLLSGSSAAYPSFFDGATGGPGLNPSYPQGPGFKKIAKNEPIMLDYMSCYNGYLIDQTRVFSIGQPPDKFVEAHNTAVKIKKEIAKSAVAGANAAYLYEKALIIAKEAGFADNFMGYDEKVKFIGHGVGLEVDEMPVFAKNFSLILKKGMVFALEPKFIFPNQGAVGIEDTFAITDNSAEQLSCFDDEIQIL